MRLLLRIFPLIIFSYLLVSCGSTKVSTPVSSTYLFLSQGGGVTGEYEGYILYEDGRVEATAGEEQGSPTPQGKLSKGETSKIFEAWKLINKENGMPYKPGNMNYKIAHGSGDDMLVIDWSDRQNIDSEIQEFFNDTFRILQSRNEKACIESIPCRLF